MQNIFDAKVAQEYIDRINNLTPETQGKWGKMSVDQVLAHLNVAYETIYEPRKTSETRLYRWITFEEFREIKNSE